MKARGFSVACEALLNFIHGSMAVIQLLLLMDALTKVLGLGIMKTHLQKHEQKFVLQDHAFGFGSGEVVNLA